jgi:hypothetical protein
LIDANYPDKIHFYESKKKFINADKTKSLYLNQNPRARIMLGWYNPPQKLIAEGPLCPPNKVKISQDLPDLPAKIIGTKR